MLQSSPVLVRSRSFSTAWRGSLPWRDLFLHIGRVAISRYQICFGFNLSKTIRSQVYLLWSQAIQLYRPCASWKVDKHWIFHQAGSPHIMGQLDNPLYEFPVAGILSLQFGWTTMVLMSCDKACSQVPLSIALLRREYHQLHVGWEWRTQILDQDFTDQTFGPNKHFAQITSCSKKVCTCFSLFTDAKTFLSVFSYFRIWRRGQRKI